MQQKNFTQNENKEKIASKKVIGLFGVGLKDALAVFNRFKVKVTIHSKYLSVKDLVLSKKSNFANISTLHAVFASSPRKSSNFHGTEFVLEGISDSVVETAKRLFLQFSPGQTILESTAQGQLLATNPGAARIYFNGVEVASEPNFLFSYNITELGENLKKNLNRERFNVGRTAYRKNIQEILLACKSKPVVNLLKETFAKYGQEELPEELS